MQNVITIGRHKVGPGQRVFVIAEIGLNHNGDIRTAKKLIDAAARAGADAAKFQTYITEKRTFVGSPIFDILKKCELPFEAFKELKSYAEKKGMVFFSTPFDTDSLAYLESIRVPVYKLASFDVVNRKFLAKVAATKKPIILSVGMADLKEISIAHAILVKGTQKIALLHCVSAYPTLEKDANLSAISVLREKFGGVVGQSDHTADIRVPLYAVAAGAQILEKHFKLNETMACVDAPVSITEKQMKDLVSEVRRLETIMGRGKIGMTSAQKGASIFRRQVK